MTRLTRRATLAAGLAATGTALLGSGALAQIPTADVPPPNFPIEPGAKLQVLRPSKFVQGDETLVAARTPRSSLTATGVEVDGRQRELGGSAAEDGRRRERRQRPRRRARLAGGPAPLRRQARPARRAGRLSRPEVRRLVPGGRGLRQDGGPAGSRCRSAATAARWSTASPGSGRPGFDTVPGDFPGYLRLCRACKKNGHPVRLGARQRRGRQRLDVLGALGLRLAR